MNIVQKKPLNILIVSYDWRNIFENNFGELIEKLERDRMAPAFNKLFLIAWSSRSYHKKNGNIETAHLKTLPFKFRLIYDLLSVFIVPFILFRTKLRPDIMVVRDFLMVPAGLLAKLFFKTKIVFFLGTMPADLAKTRKFAFFRLFYQRLGEISAKPFIDVFIANGTTTRDYLVQMGVPFSEIKIMIEDVIKRDQDIIGASIKGRMRQLYKIPADKKILLSVGRLEKEKNFEGLLNAISKIKLRNFILIIVGGGTLKDDLEIQAKKLGLEGRIIFSGPVYRDRIWDYYNDADAFILLSRSEGSPTVFREAMYMGVPVIGSKIAPIKEFVGEVGLRGFVWDKIDGADKLETILSSCFAKSGEIVGTIARARAYIDENIAGNLIINDFIQ